MFEYEREPIFSLMPRIRVTDLISPEERSISPWLEERGGARNFRPMGIKVDDGRHAQG